MPDKVVSMFDRERKPVKEKPDEDNLSFEEIMKRNAANAERVKQERIKANKWVTRSYRLKTKKK